MEIIKSNIKFNINLYQNEGIKNFETDIFPPHFLMTICGKPGSGKTTLLKFMLKSPKFFFKKFDFVYIICPSYKEYETLFLPQGNFIKKLNWKWIKSKIENINTNYKNQYINVLFILDDVICDLYNSQFSQEIMEFIFNRRHLLNNGMISIILTSQKFTRIPTEIRSSTNVLIIFKMNNICRHKIYEDIIFEEKDKYEEVMKNVFGNKNIKQNFLIYRICNNTFYKNFDRIILK
jgi:Cdc6-like AAA superfamily ATPase